MKIKGYAIKEQKLIILCDCGQTFLQKVAQKIVRCPSCKLSSHKKFIFTRKAA